MTTKQEHIAKEQSRDKHPERLAKGSGAEMSSRGAQAKGNPADHQQPGVGKVENDHNKQGAQAKTQINQPARTPASRHDRENQAGSHNEIQARTGGKGGGRSPRGAG